MTYGVYGNMNYEPKEPTMNVDRIKQAFADLNLVLAEEGSTYGVRGVFTSDTLIRTQVIRLASEEDSVEFKVYATAASTAKSYVRNADGQLQLIGSETVNTQTGEVIDA